MRPTSGHWKSLVSRHHRPDRSERLLHIQCDDVERGTHGATSWGQSGAAAVSKIAHLAIAKVEKRLITRWGRFYKPKRDARRSIASVTATIIMMRC